MEFIKVMFKIRFGFFGIAIAVSCFSCQNNAPESTGIQQVSKPAFKALAPEFNADSAYTHIKNIVGFGPRVPGTKAHHLAGDYIKNVCIQNGFKVVEQKAPVQTYDGKSHQIRNIIASWKPDNSKRILFLTHWDSRPIADNDSVRKDQPIDGADDGGSGTGILLELCRVLKQHNPDIGIDILFTDLEDYGQPDNSGFPQMPDSWCLGTQYWASSPHLPGYTAKFGILLDMVGHQNAKFPKEGTGMNYASDLVDKVWNIGKALGYSSYFIDDKTHPTTDDHLYVNKNAGIPCIDIVYMDPVSGHYGPHHHTHNDKLGVISVSILKVVGQTITEVIWQEK